MNVAMRAGGRFGLFVGLATLAATSTVAGQVRPRSAVVAAAGEPAPVDPVRFFLEERVRDDPDDVTAWNRLGGLYLAESRGTGDLRALDRAETAARESLRAVPAEQNFGGLALRAQTAQAAHRFAAARADGERLAGMAPGRGEAWAILGDACFELGDYAEAARAWGELRRLEPVSVATEIRRSRLAFIQGDRREAARRLKAALAAAEEMTPRPAETVAWCGVQLGELAFSAGEWKTAEARYRAALETSPGWYVAVDHLAEARAAQGDFNEAVRLYEGLAERMRRPEIWQTLGDVLAEAGRAAEAAAWHERALTGYLAEAEAGNAHYHHHLAGFYLDVRGNAEEALRWARKDLETRRSVAAWGALAEALYLSKDYAGAAEAMENALAQGTRDAHLLMHAAAIFTAMGDEGRGGACRRAAWAVNPRLDGFQVHR